MNIHDHLKALQTEFRDKYGVDVNIQVTAYRNENLLTHREARLFQSILTTQTPEWTPSVLPVTEGRFTSYEVENNDGLSIRLHVDGI